MVKAGILGGGQLGRMLLQAAANYPVETYVMEKDPLCPAAHLCHHFITGDITNFDDVYSFGKNLDCLSIEIENVNTEALEKLESEGVRIYPKPAVLRTIKNKILQKQFYTAHDIPTSPYIITQNRQELAAQSAFLPAVHKAAMGGYDGKGVQLLHTGSDLELGFDEPAILEKMVQIKKEIAIIVAVNDKNHTVIYPPVDMVFDPRLNLLLYQVSPAVLPEKVFWKAEAIALRLVKAFNSPGIFAVELFADEDDNVWVNEVAPRVHNSGHHTIEANYCSQFDMLWRIMLGFPPGNTDCIIPSSLVNIVGDKDASGEPNYEGLNEILAMDNVFVHLYGKQQVKPGRKMGHVTVISIEMQELLHKARQISQVLKAKGNPHPSI